MEFNKSLEKRRSYYGISKESTVSDELVINIVKEAVKHSPSAFNNQSQAAVLLLGAEHDILWDIVMESLRSIVPSAAFEATEKKINAFKSGSGTVLYYNDDSVTKGMQEKYPLYASNFPVWAEQANGMLQFVIWNMLENEGLGASLQHYNPIIDAKVKEAFQIPVQWRLIAQMPFGKPTAQPEEKTFIPIENRVKIKGSRL